VSNGIRKRLEMRGFAGERLVVIPNGICTANSGENITDRRRPVQLLEERYDVSLKGKKIIISVSRLVPKKGIAEFVENISPKITAKCPQAVFFIAGHGPERSRVSNAISRFKFEDRVILAGELKHGGPELKALFGAADVFVMPNRAVGNDFEGFGLVVLEAGINGVPVVAYDVDGISEALHDRQNGLLVKGSDAASFADAVLMLLNDDSLRMDLSRRSREYVKNNFDWENIVSRYTDQYKKLLMGGCAHAV
jgi:glycosyltransferase involved in cell wall biosynthesis